MTDTAPNPSVWRTKAKLLVSLRADGLHLQQNLLAPLRPIDVAAAVTLSELSSNGADDLDELRERVLQEYGGDPAALASITGAAHRGGRIGRMSENARPIGSVTKALGTGDDTTALPDHIDLFMPIVFQAVDGKFEAFDHDGDLIVQLDPLELRALAQVVEESDPDLAYAAHVAEVGDRAISQERFVAILNRLYRAKLATDLGAGSPRIEIEMGFVKRDGAAHRLRDAFREQADRLDEAEAARAAADGGTKRPKVIPVAFDIGPPTGLGYVFAYAKAYEDGKLDNIYDFRLDWKWDEAKLDDFTAEPAIYLFSNYLWSHEQCIDISERIKQRSPNSITIHGGPDTPKYHRDCEEYFHRYPHIDITVRGEGELSAAEVLDALTSVIGSENPDLSVLEGIEGISYRGADGAPRRNGDRDRITDLNTIPSPFLTGLFDGYIGSDELYVILETNRGCPYGCTFCDWGSATASRIRQFDLDRVLAEVDWCSSSQASFVTLADANYGIFKRDVEIAQRVADLKNATSFPGGFGANYAKNTVKHLRQIVSILASADILTQGTLSLQSMDEDTLSTIRRSNIKTEKYDALATEMREADLPLMIELMMGLPGATVASFREDLQQCIDRELPARVNHTALLVNSPMNDPEYMAENQIETAVALGPGKTAVLASTRSYTAQDLGEMEQLRLDFHFMDNYGVLRVVSRHVRQQTGVSEMQFFQELRHNARGDNDRWPALTVLVELCSSMMAPPVSWKLMIDELHRYLVEIVGLEDDSALATILKVQHAVLPAHGRTFPQTIELDHDVDRWWNDLLAVKEAGNRHDWAGEIADLSTYGPATFTIDDTRNVCRDGLGIHREINSFGINWELDSPISRATATVNTW